MCEATCALPLISTIGFEGKVFNGLFCTGQSLIYAIGSNVIKADTVSGQQQFMIGHGNNVTCIDVDRTCRYIASGQMNFMGFKADVILWDASSCCMIGRYASHSTRVNAVCFSSDGRYLLSVGNLDDHGSIVIYDMEQCKCVTGGKACQGRNGIPKCAASTNKRNNVWVIGGDDYLSLWILDMDTNRLRTEKANLKKIKRDILTVQVDANDEFAYCGTGTGDVLKIKLNLPVLGGGCDPLGPPSPGPTICAVVTRLPIGCERGRNAHLYKGGVTALQILDNGDMIVGAGNGTVAQSALKIVCRGGDQTLVMKEYGPQMCVRGQATSIAVCCQDVFVGSTLNEVYHSKLAGLDHTKMLASAHYSVVMDISFPACYSEVFASCNFEDIRIWNACAMRELVRINVANVTCNCVIFSKDGRSIISGWSDSNIRAYTPQTGSPLWIIYHAHIRGVTALTIYNSGERLVTGGEAGQVRIWALCPQQQTPIAIMKEHIGPITGLRIKSDDSQVVSSSADGSIIIWCLEKFVRKTLVLQDTLFLDVAWHPSECQIIGVTHNHKLGYYETFDGSTIREIIASESDPVLSVDVSPDGCYIVTGGADRQVKLWSYRDGCQLRAGCVHSDEVTRVRFSPCSDYILSCCRDGSIFKWEYPKCQ